MGRATHVLRMMIIILILAAVGFTAQRLLRPAGFGQAGHYRFGSLADILAQPPVHQTKAACVECHGEICKVHGKDIHFGVQCEDCHGPANLHVRHHRDHDPAVPAADAVLPKKYTLEGCLFCHRRLEARPRNFPQVDPAEHFAFLHVKDPATRCVACHSPHEPLFLLSTVEEARIHPVIYECGDCHATKPERPHTEVKDHPAIFVCGDCHGEIVKDFEGRDHAFMRCTGCHLFHRENDTAGRIFRDGNRKFCLLCHESKPFKDAGAIKLIDPVKHMANLSSRSGKDPAELAKDPRSCLACHMEFIHDPELFKKKE